MLRARTSPLSWRFAAQGSAFRCRRPLPLPRIPPLAGMRAGGAGAGGRDGRGRSGKPLERDAASATRLACACPVIRHASLLGHTVAAIACTDACCSCESRSFLAATAPYSSCLDLTQVLPSQTFHHHDLHGEAPDAARPGLPHTRPLRTRYLPIIPTLPCR